MKFKIVLIEWMDSHGVVTHWEKIDDLEPLKPVQCRTVGYLIKNSKKYKTVAQSVGGNQVLGRMTIPAKSITNIVEIKV